MNCNPFVNQLLAEERMKDGLRQAEQARLARAAEKSGMSWKERLPMYLRFWHALRHWRNDNHSQEWRAMTRRSMQ